jgi:hypothetical protein
MGRGDKNTNGNNNKKTKTENTQIKIKRRKEKVNRKAILPKPEGFKDRPPRDKNRNRNDFRRNDRKSHRK